MRACASPHPFGIMLRLGRAVARLVQALRLARGDAGLPRTLSVEQATQAFEATAALTLAGHRAGGGVLK